MSRSINAKMRSLQEKIEGKDMKKRTKKGWRLSVNEGAINKQSNMFTRLGSKAKGMIKR